MEQVILNICKLGELSEESQRKAHDNWMYSKACSDSFDWDGIRETLGAFAKEFGITVRDFDVAGGYGTIWWESDFTYEQKQLRGVRLLKFIHNNFWQDLVNMRRFRCLSGAARTSKILVGEFDCMGLTGVCYDISILQPLKQFMESPSDDVTLEDLVNKCLQEFQKMCSSDYDYHISAGGFSEWCDWTDARFLPDGTNAYKILQMINQ